MVVLLPLELPERLDFAVGEVPLVGEAIFTGEGGFLMGCSWLGPLEEGEVGPEESPGWV